MFYFLYSSHTLLYTLCNFFNFSVYRKQDCIRQTYYFLTKQKNINEYTCICLIWLYLFHCTSSSSQSLFTLFEISKNASIIVRSRNTLDCLYMCDFVWRWFPVNTTSFVILWLVFFVCFIWFVTRKKMSC